MKEQAVLVTQAGRVADESDDGVDQRIDAQERHGRDDLILNLPLPALPSLEQVTGTFWTLVVTGAIVHADQIALLGRDPGGWISGR